MNFRTFFSYLRHKKTLIGLTLVGSILSHSNTALAWGAKGHQIVAYAGAQLAMQGSEYWRANALNLRQLSTVPDRVWKMPATKNYEASNHWFQIDAYTQNFDLSEVIKFPHDYSQAVSTYGSSAISKNGTAPWRINQFYSQALKALQQGDAQKAIILVGVMSHYIGDLSQPLHVSENYDGQKSNNDGIHKFFETDNIKDEKAALSQVIPYAQKLLQTPEYVSYFKSSVMDSSLGEISRAIMWKDSLLQIDTEQGRTGDGATQLYNLAVRRMADGAASFAIILSKLWQDSGANIAGETVDIQDPAFIQNNFGNNDFSHQYSTSSMEYDCQ